MPFPTPTVTVLDREARTVAVDGVTHHLEPCPGEDGSFAVVKPMQRKLTIGLIRPKGSRHGPQVEALRGRGRPREAVLTAIASVWWEQ